MKQEKLLDLEKAKLALANRKLDVREKEVAASKDIEKKPKKTKSKKSDDVCKRIEVGHKPKNAIPDANTGPKLLQAVGQEVVIDLRPSINFNRVMREPVRKPTGPVRVVVPIRESTSILTGNNPFYKSSRRAEIEKALVDLSYQVGVEWNTDITFDAWIDLLNKAGWDAEITVQ